MFFKENHYIVSPFLSSPPHFQNISRNLQYAAQCYRSIQPVVVHTTGVHNKGFASTSLHFSKSKKNRHLYSKIYNVLKTLLLKSGTANEKMRGPEVQKTLFVTHIDLKIFRNFQNSHSTEHPQISVF